MANAFDRVDEAVASVFPDNPELGREAARQVRELLEGLRAQVPASSTKKPISDKPASQEVAQLFVPAYTISQSNSTIEIVAAPSTCHRKSLDAMIADVNRRLGDKLPLVDMGGKAFVAEPPLSPDELDRLLWTIRYDSRNAIRTEVIAPIPFDPWKRRTA